MNSKPEPKICATTLLFGAHRLICVRPPKHRGRHVNTAAGTLTWISKPYGRFKPPDVRIGL